jgi:hypothetical protein
MWLWFGPEPWVAVNGQRSQVCEDDDLRTPIPLDEVCRLCDEAFASDDCGVYARFTLDAGERRLPCHIECLTAFVRPGPRPFVGVPLTLRQEARLIWLMTYIDGMPEAPWERDLGWWGGT